MDAPTSDFESQAAKKPASFVTRIVPTSSQLKEWPTQLEKDSVSGEEFPASKISSDDTKNDKI